MLPLPLLYIKGFNNPADSLQIASSDITKLFSKTSLPSDILFSVTCIPKVFCAEDEYGVRVTDTQFILPVRSVLIKSNPGSGRAKSYAHIMAQPPTINFTPAEGGETITLSKGRGDTTTSAEGGGEVMSLPQRTRTNDSLDNTLRKNTVKHRDGYEKYFLTIHCLRRLLPAAKVEKHLATFFEKAKGAGEQGYQPRNVNMSDYLRLICNQDSPPARSGTANGKSYIRLFAALVLADRGLDIFKFIDESISDEALPLSVFGTDERLFKKWEEQRSLDSFNMWQWKVNVPFLTHDQHQIFDHRTVLPFIEVSEQQNQQQTQRPEQPDRLSPRSRITEAGGYGEVSCVEIHQDCHNLDAVFGSVRDYHMLDVRLYR